MGAGKFLGAFSRAFERPTRLAAEPLETLSGSRSPFVNPESDLLPNAVNLRLDFLSRLPRPIHPLVRKMTRQLCRFGWNAFYATFCVSPHDLKSPPHLALCRPHGASNPFGRASHAVALLALGQTALPHSERAPLRGGGFAQ
jgi:hypothetical protein